MDYQHDPYASKSWRRAAFCLLVIVVCSAGMLLLASALGLELQF